MNTEYPDLWWEARQRTAAYKGQPLERLITWATRSFPGAATKQVPMQIITAGRGLGVDLNKYRTGVNVQMLYDLGVRIFDLRLFGPTRWVYGDWRYEQDATFEGYYQQLMNLEGAIIGGYGVYNPWLDEESGYTTPLDPNVELAKLYAKNFPRLDYLMWDVEVGECVKGANQHNGITSINLVKGLSRTMSQTAKEMPHWPGTNYPRTPEMYSATWFLLPFGDPVKVWLENVLADLNNLPFLTWMAWIPVVFSEAFTTPQQLYDKEITPNGVQENAYLHVRSEPLASKWQCSWALKGPWSPTVGIDCSLTYGPGAQLTQYRVLHNMPTTVTPPPPEEPPADDDLAARVNTLEVETAALQQDMAELKTFKANVKAA